MSNSVMVGSLLEVTENIVRKAVNFESGGAPSDQRPHGNGPTETAPVSRTGRSTAIPIKPIASAFRKLAPNFSRSFRTRFMGALTGCIRAIQRQPTGPRESRIGVSCAVDL